MKLCYVYWNYTPLAVACRNDFSEIAHLLADKFEIPDYDMDFVVNSRCFPIFM